MQAAPDNTAPATIAATKAAATPAAAIIANANFQYAFSAIQADIADLILVAAAFNCVAIQTAKSLIAIPNFTIKS